MRSETGDTGAESGTAQGQGRKTTTEARDAIEEVSHLLQVIGVSTSTEGTEKKAEIAETIGDQHRGLTLV